MKWSRSTTDGTLKFLSRLLLYIPAIAFVSSIFGAIVSSPAFLIITLATVLLYVISSLAAMSGYKTKAIDAWDGGGDPGEYVNLYAWLPVNVGDNTLFLTWYRGRYSRDEGLIVEECEGSPKEKDLKDRIAELEKLLKEKKDGDKRDST